MNKLVIISGPSGVGKGTVVKELQKLYKENDKKLYLSISCTTRGIREGEKEAVNYYFISEEEFIEMINEHDFLEYNKYGTGKYYGTPRGKVIDFLESGYDVILEIDINGYRQIKENYPECIGIFIMPPSMDELEKRLRDRKTETEEAIEMRLKTAREEVAQNSVYDHIIVNEDGKSAEAAKKLYLIMNESD